MHYSMGNPACSNFRVITANFSGVQILRYFYSSVLKKSELSHHMSQQADVCAQQKISSAWGIHPVWSESSLSTWRKIKSLATHKADMTRLIRVFAGRTSHFVGLVMRRLNCRTASSDIQQLMATKTSTTDRNYGNKSTDTWCQKCKYGMTWYENIQNNMKSIKNEHFYKTKAKQSTKWDFESYNKSTYWNKECRSKLMLVYHYCCFVSTRICSSKKKKEWLTVRYPPMCKG